MSFEGIEMTNANKTDTKADLIQAHADMVAVLDAKMANLPEWKAFRSIDRALIGLINAPAKNEESKSAAARTFRKLKLKSPKSSYVDMGLAALDITGKPLPTTELVKFIAERRDLDDLEKARINIVSAFSHDERMRSISWIGGPAWWHADRPIPKKESAG